jgi:acyl carrier protein
MSEDSRVARGVITILIERLGMPSEAVTPAAELIEDLGVDSVDAVELTLALEREFGMSLPDDVLADVRTVQDVIDLIGERTERVAAVASD